MVRRKDPRIRLHPMARRQRWAETCVPISLHGDAVPCIAVGKAGSRSLDVFSWQAVLASTGSSVDMKNYIYSIFEHCKAKDGQNTMTEIWAVVLWSLSALFLGKWPDKDHKGNDWPEGSAEAMMSGTDLAGGFCAVVWQLKGDLDYFCKALGLRSYNANKPCDLCPCDKDREVDWWPNNFGPTAQWMLHQFTPDQWRALYPDGLHPLFSFPCA